MSTKDLATFIVKKLVDAGYVAYFAGGWVRDYVMRHPPDDIDIATSAPVEKIVELFPRTIPVGIAFGVVIVVEDSHQFEVSTFRKDMEYDGRRPGKIELSSAQEDATRRDFTINGMFYDPLEDKINDYVNGLEDIKKGVIRTIGDPNERFVEDRLRMIRAARLAARFSFAIDPSTRKAIEKNANTLFPAVAIERIWQELSKMTKFPHADGAIIEMYQLGLLPVIFLEIQDVSLDDIKQRVKIFKHFPKKCPTILYILELFPDATLEQLLKMSQYLKTSTDDQKLVEYMVKAKEMVAHEDEMNDVSWAHFYADPHSQLCLDVIASRYPVTKRQTFLDRHLKRCERLLPHVERLAHRKKLVTGRILQALGIPPGKLMGELLTEAQSIAIMRDLHDSDEVIEILKKSALWSKT